MSLAGGKLASIFAKNFSILVKEGLKLHLGRWHKILSVLNMQLFLAFRFVDVKDARPVNADQFQPVATTEEDRMCRL